MLSVTHSFANSIKLPKQSWTRSYRPLFQLDSFSIQNFAPIINLIANFFSYSTDFQAPGFLVRFSSSIDLRIQTRRGFRIQTAVAVFFKVHTSSLHEGDKRADVARVSGELFLRANESKISCSWHDLPLGGAKKRKYIMWQTRKTSRQTLFFFKLHKRFCTRIKSRE